MKRLYNNSSYPWKVIPSYLIDTYLGKKFKPTQSSVDQLTI